MRVNKRLVSSTGKKGGVLGVSIVIEEIISQK